MTSPLLLFFIHPVFPVRFASLLSSSPFFFFFIPHSFDLSYYSFFLPFSLVSLSFCVCCVFSLPFFLFSYLSFFLFIILLSLSSYSFTFLYSKSLRITFPPSFHFHSSSFRYFTFLILPFLPYTSSFLSSLPSFLSFLHPHNTTELYTPSHPNQLHHTSPLLTSTHHVYSIRSIHITLQHDPYFLHAGIH